MNRNEYDGYAGVTLVIRAGLGALLVLAAIGLACLLCGCTTFRVVQTDESPDERIIRTELSATAWFTSAQGISKIKALQTDKTQSFGTDALGQHGATNTTEVLKAIANILQLIRPTP